MFYLLRSVAPMACVVMLTACGDLFSANFEADTPGLPPSADPWGAPFDDYISVGPEKSFFVTSGHGIVGEQSYAFVEAKPEASQTDHRTVLRSTPIKDLTRPVHVTWRGKFGTGGGLMVTVGYLGQAYVKLGFNSGDVFVQDQMIGSYVPGDNHTVSIKLFPKEERFEFAMAGDANLHRSFAQGNASSKSSLTAPQAYADFSITQSKDGHLVYILDDVRMSHNASQ